jgi:hypothetical protein
MQSLGIASIMDKHGRCRDFWPLRQNYYRALFRANE